MGISSGDKRMKKGIAEAIFWLHFIIVGVWFLLLFVPLSWWKGRIEFHFFLSIGIVVHQFVWPIVLLPWTKRYGGICILTTFMQWARGIPLSDERNFRHSWTKEFFLRFGLRPSPLVITVVPLSILLISAIQYFTLR